MEVKFNATYFAGTDQFRPDKLRVMSGKRYRKGVVYNLTDAEYDKAVKDGASFHVISGAPAKVKTAPVVDPFAGTLRDFDAERAASDDYVEAVDEASEAADQVVQKRGRGRPRKDA